MAGDLNVDMEQDIDKRFHNELVKLMVELDLYFGKTLGSRVYKHQTTKEIKIRALDYICASPTLEKAGTSRRVTTSNGGSDHFPIEATFSIALNKNSNSNSNKDTFSVNDFKTNLSIEEQIKFKDSAIWKKEPLKFNDPNISIDTKYNALVDWIIKGCKDALPIKPKPTVRSFSYSQQLHKLEVLRNKLSLEMNIILKGANLQQIKTERQRYLKKLFTTIHMLKERIRRMKMRNRNISFSKFEKKLQEEGNKGSRTFFKLTSRTRVSQYPDSLNGKVFDDEIEEEITEEYQNIYSNPLVFSILMTNPIYLAILLLHKIYPKRKLYLLLRASNRIHQLDKSRLRRLNPSPTKKFSPKVFSGN